MWTQWYEGRKKEADRPQKIRRHETVNGKPYEGEEVKGTLSY